MPSSPPAGSHSIPILLLKTKSSPTDAYEELLSTAEDGRFSPRFVPVLQHCFEDVGMSKLRCLLQARCISSDPGGLYGGLVFTSQRAVEAFAKLVHEGAQGSDPSWPHLQDIPIYSVGPATTRALKAIPQGSAPLQIFGEHTGTGEALAHFILDHYASWYSGRETKPPLLFPAGEQRRDIIPKTLMDDSLPANRRIKVTEEVVYGTGVMESFPRDFDGVLAETSSAPERWVVVFSPTGCDSMLRGLGLLNSDIDKATGAAETKGGKTLIVTIGPTTQQYLISAFGFEPDACAEKPSPEGVLQGIVDYQP